MGQNTKDQIARTKNKFSTCTFLSLHESACIRIHAFWSANLRMYTDWLRETNKYLFFFHSESLNYNLSSKWVAINDNTCVVVPNLCHNSNNLPLWTWWQLQVALPLFYQGQRVMLPLNTCWILWYVELCCSCSPWLKARSAKRCSTRRTKTWYIINDLPITSNSYIHPFPNQVGIYQKFIHGKTRTLHHPSQA